MAFAIKLEFASGELRLFERWSSHESALQTRIVSASAVSRLFENCIASTS